MKLHIQILIISLSSALLSAQTYEPSTTGPAPEPSKNGVGGAGGLGDICKQTQEPQFCEETIGPKLEPGETATPMMALIKEVETLAEEAKQAVTAATDAQTTDPGNASSYQVCMEMFTDCGDELLTAKDALAANDKDTANVRISGVMTLFSSCEEAFAQSGQPCTIAETTARLNKLASNCLAIAAIQ